MTEGVAEQIAEQVNETPAETGPALWVELVDPGRARQLLAYNTGNRPIHRLTVERYAADMTAGRWRFVGDPLRFIALPGGWRLLDGQHRLAAIVESGTSQSFTFIEVAAGPDEAAELFSMIDQGRKRTLGDVLSLRGLDALGSNKGHVLTAVRAVGFLELFVPLGYIAYNRLTLPQLDALAVQFPEETRFAALVRKQGKARLDRHLGVGALAAAIACWRVAPDEAAEFFEAVTRGERLVHDEPIYALRQYLLSQRSREMSGGHRAATGSYQVVIRAWNYHWRAERVTRLVVHPNNEKLPRPIDPNAPVQQARERES